MTIPILPPSVLGPDPKSMRVSNDDKSQCPPIGVVHFNEISEWGSEVRK